MALSNVGLFAMYTISKVESGSRWDAINYNDPITTGIGQWFGTRAAELLNRPKIKEQWGSIAGSLRSDLESRDPGNGWWASRYLTREEGESLRPILSSAGGKEEQTWTWQRDLNASIATMAQFGFSESNPKPLILVISAYHQSPKRGLRIARDYGGDSTLDRIFAAIKADPVLSKYITYRYGVNYKDLQAWDGTSPPPDFGATTGTVSGDSGEVRPSERDEDERRDDPNAESGLRIINQVGNDLIITLADGRKISAYYAGQQSWLPSQGTKPVDTSGPDFGRIPPPTPPADGGAPQPDPGSGIWVHPAPTRKAVSSPSTWENPSRQGHRGADFSGPIGTPIYAVGDGVVIKAGASNGFGYAIGIRHPDGVATGYGHMDISQILVKVGDTVKRGQQIAGMNTKGQSTGSHLHFEVYGNGQWASGHIWPEKALRDRGVTKF